MITIRIFTGGFGCLTGALGILAIPGILLLYYTAAQEQKPPPSVYESACAVSQV